MTSNRHGYYWKILPPGEYLVQAFVEDEVYGKVVVMETSSISPVNVTSGAAGVVDLRLVASRARDIAKLISENHN